MYYKPRLTTAPQSSSALPDFQTAYPTEKPCCFESHGNVSHESDESHGNVSHESDELPALHAYCSRNHPVFRAALCATGLTNG